MKHLLTLLLLLASTSLMAQNLKIEKSPSAAEALTKINAAQTTTSQTSISGYRIGIFFDNSQEARSKANQARDLFVENFSEPVYVIYESPYYKVSAGNCLTEEEAIMLFERVRKVFPNAYMMREQMKIADFIEKPTIDTVSTAGLSNNQTVVE